MAVLGEGDLSILGRATLDSSLQGVCILQEGKFIYLNERFARMVGYAGEEMLDWGPEQFVEKLVHPDFQETAKSRYRARMRGEAQTTQYEQILMTRSGEEIWVELLVHPIALESGPAVHVSILDITDRKQAEQALRESEQQYRSVTENSFDAIVVYDEERYFYTNPAYTSLVGYTADELKRLRPHGLVHPDHRQGTAVRTRGVIDGRAVEPRHEFALIHKNGAAVWVESVTRAISSLI